MTAHQGYKSFEEFRAWATERMLAIKDKIMLSDLQYFEMRKEFFAMLALQGFVQSFFYIPSLYKLKKVIREVPQADGRFQREIGAAWRLTELIKIGLEVTFGRGWKRRSRPASP
eukprot:m.205936 g.205936  ORF g.205936 m.205936 type:complete len:114 (+) comp10119_c0_seq47:906-1247(+)